MEAQRKIKKRKINEISKNDQAEVVKIESKMSSSVNLGKKATDIKECPFNPFGDESCDMCGSWLWINYVDFIDY